MDGDSPSGHGVQSRLLLWTGSVSVAYRVCQGRHQEDPILRLKTLKKKNHLFIYEKHRERKRQRDPRGEPQHGTDSILGRITSWAERGPKPLRALPSKLFKNFSHA